MPPTIAARLLRLLVALILSLAALPCSALGADVDRTIREAASLVKRGDQEGAIRLVKTSLDKDPRDVVLHRMYQTLLANAGRGAEVEKQYRDRLEADPGNGLMAYLFLAVSNDERESRAMLEKTRKISPNDPWLQAADTILAVSGDIAEGKELVALERLDHTASLKLAHDDWASRAWAYMELGRFGDAEREANAGRDFMPFDPAAFEALGRVYCDTSRFERCLKAYDSALRLRDSPSARFSRAYALRMNGRMPESEKDFDAALAMTPISVGDWAAQAWIHGYRGDLKTSWDAMNEARQRTSCQCMKTAVVWLELRIFGAKQARKDCDAILKLNPRSVEARMLSGAIHQEQGCECEEAIADFDAVLKTNPRYLTAWLGKARANLTLGRAHAALSDARSALKLAPKDWETVLLMAGASVAARRYDDSARFARDSIGLNAENPEARVVLGKAYLLLGRPTDAARAFEDARAHRGAWEPKAVEDSIKTAQDEARTARFKESISPRKPMAQETDFSKAPSSIKEFLNAPDDYGAMMRLPHVRIAGSDEADWLKKIVLSETEAIASEKRSFAAADLERLKRWDDLLDILAAGGRGGMYAIGPLSGELRSSDSAHIPLARIEKEAAGGNSAALLLLGMTKDPRHVQTCAGRLLFSYWPSQREPFNDTVARFLAVCPNDRDLEVRNAAVDCLESLEAPSAIPALLDAAEKNGGAIRHRIFSALSSIAKENFGQTTGLETPGAQYSFCKDSSLEVWELTQSSQPTAQSLRQLDAAVRVAEDMAARDAAGDAAAPILAAWRNWWLAQAGRVPTKYAERTITEVRAPDADVTLALLSSGKVAVRGPRKNESTFTSISSLESILGHGDGRWVFQLPPEQAQRVAVWAKEKAIPALRLASVHPN